jgi:hypothetical protein
MRIRFGFASILARAACRYTDEDGDVVTVGTDAELREAVANARRQGSPLKLDVFVVATDSHAQPTASASSQPAAPQPSAAESLRKLVASILSSMGPQIVAALKMPHVADMARSLGLQFDASAPNLQSIGEQLERNEMLRDLFAQFASMRDQAATYRDQAADACTSSALAQMFMGAGASGDPLAQLFGPNGEQPHPLAAMFARATAPPPTPADSDEDLYGNAGAGAAGTSPSSFGGCADAWWAGWGLRRAPHDRQNRHASRSASASSTPAKHVQLLAHETVPSGTVMLPEQAFVKIWRAKALCDWPAGARCQYSSGERIGDHRATIVAPDGGSTVRDGTEVSVALCAVCLTTTLQVRIVLDGQTTQRIGRQRSVYRLVSANGDDLGGDDLVIDVEVAKPL